MSEIASARMICVAVPEAADLEDVRLIHQGVWYAGAFPFTAFGRRIARMGPNCFPNSRIFPALHAVRLCHALLIYSEWKDDPVVRLQERTAKYLGRLVFVMVTKKAEAFAAEMTVRQGLEQAQRKARDDETTMESENR